MCGNCTAAPIICRVPAFGWASGCGSRPLIPWWRIFRRHAEIAQLLRETSWSPATELVLLDAGEPDGYRRQWQAPGLPPMRHVAYAVQWFALATHRGVIYVVTNLRRETAKQRPA